MKSRVERGRDDDQHDQRGVHAVALQPGRARARGRRGPRRVRSPRSSRAPSSVRPPSSSSGAGSCPASACIRSSAVTSAPSSCADDRAVLEHDDAVRALDQLLQLGGDQQHGRALRGQLVDQRLHLGLRADVDAAGRLVEQQHLGVQAQPAGQQHLLLVAAGQVARPAAPGSDALIRSRSHEEARRSRPAWRRRPCRPGTAGAARRATMFSRTERPGMMPSALRSSGSIAMPARIAARGLRRRIGLAVDLDRAGRRWAAPRRSPCAVSLRPAPSSPPRPTTSPGAPRGETPCSRCRSVRPRRVPSRAPRAGRQRSAIALAPAGALGRRTRWPWPSRAAAMSRPSISETSSSRVSPAIAPGVHDAAVAQHGDPVADLVQLVEPVADVHHRDALLPQGPDDAEERLDLARLEATRSARP